jgi:GTP pyrophosphokinase
MKTIDQFLKRIDKLKIPVSKVRIKLAYNFAALAHEGQKRFSGEPYILHPLEVANKLLDFNPDEDMIVAALLHDVSEDTDRTLDDIEEVFGPGVRALVRSLEKLSKVRAKVNEPQVENLRKMFVAMATDLRVILIKLCDRWHNMETLEHVREEKQKRIAKETLEIYVPIASRLGIFLIKSNLEDLCFKYLYKEFYEDIDGQLMEFGKERTRYMQSVANSIKKFVNEKGFTAQIDARVKTHYSIYRKLKKKGKSSIDDIFDVFAVRVIVPSKFFENGDEDNALLYQILGQIHSKWTPLAARFKDYIAVPKPNGYRSLHTTLVGLGPKNFNQPVEIQIRSEKMHREAEFGIASHWIYEDVGVLDDDTDFAKLSTRPKKAVLKSQVAWLKALDDLQKDVKNNTDFIRDLQTDLFNDRIFVLTPKGDVRDLPQGATPVDFAYSVHSDVGNKIAMAKVNGMIVPLDYELRNGQVVDIITRKNSEPNQFWLSFVKTNSAKNKIKSWFKSKDTDKNLKAGRDLMNKYLEKVGKPILDADGSILKTYGKKRLTVKEREDLLVEVGLGMISPTNIVKAVYPLEDLLTSTQQIETISSKTKTVSKSTLGEVMVDGQTGIPFRFATCCKPKKSDQIVGYISRLKSVAIHKSSCKMVLKGNPTRMINVAWVSSEPNYNGKYRVNLVLELNDRVGILRDISNITYDMNINIVDLSLQSPANGGAVKLRHLIVEVTDYDELDKLLNKLERIDSVLSVKKID